MIPIKGCFIHIFIQIYVREDSLLRVVVSSTRSLKTVNENSRNSSSWCIISETWKSCTVSRTVYQPWVTFKHFTHETVLRIRLLSCWVFTSVCHTTWESEDGGAFIQKCTKVSQVQDREWLRQTRLVRQVFSTRPSHVPTTYVLVLISGSGTVPESCLLCKSLTSYFDEYNKISVVQLEGKGPSTTW